MPAWQYVMTATGRAGPGRAASRSGQSKQLGLCVQRGSDQTERPPISAFTPRTHSQRPVVISAMKMGAQPNWITLA